MGWRESVSEITVSPTAFGTATCTNMQRAKLPSRRLRSTAAPCVSGSEARATWWESSLMEQHVGAGARVCVVNGGTDTQHRSSRACSQGQGVRRSRRSLVRLPGTL